MPRVVLTGYIDIPSKALADVLAELANHIELTRAEPGCLVFEVAQDPACAARLTVYEEFASAAAFEAHQARVARSRWGRLTAGAERHYQLEYL